MALFFKILGSSSSGNSALLITPKTKILIDAGFTGKKMEELLKNVGENIDDIDAIFFTHEHSDHSLGLKGLSKKSHLKFFANRDTATTLQKNLSRPVNWHLFETGTSFQFNDLEVTSFPIPHDAYDPVGYLFRYQETRLAWATDLGYIPKLVQEKILQADILVLEANYDEFLLDNDTKRPWSIKQRIKGRHGHLSNEAAFNFLSQAENPSWKQVYLAHLSRDCNNIDQIKKTFSSLIDRENAFRIEIVAP